MATESSPSTLLILLVVFSGLIVPHCMADDVLLSGDNLYSGSSLNYDGYSLTMQQDCNLVLYDNGNPVWASETYNRDYNCRLAMQRDGNLVIYEDNGGAVWASNTARDDGNYVLVLQRDRNVVIYGSSIWATGSNWYGTPGVVIITGNMTQQTTSVAAAHVAANAAPEPNNRKISMTTVINLIDDQGDRSIGKK